MTSIKREQAKKMVGAGWSEILDTLYDAKPKNVSVVQVKEKYGTLRFYVGSCDESFANLIAEMEQKSAVTCEYCGDIGKPRDLPWIKTLCDKCYKREKREVRKIFGEL